MKNQKLSLTELALRVTVRNLEKQKENANKKVATKKRKSTKVKPKEPVVIVKGSSGIVAYLPEGMKYSSLSKKIDKNEDVLINFK